jgi:hypothetical protein
MPLLPAAQKVYDRLAPYQAADAANGYTLRDIVEASTGPTEDVYALSTETATHPSFGKAFDPDLAPAWLLSWLAQIPGVKLRPGDTEAQQRARITAAAGFFRGTLQAIKDETALVLTGTKTVRAVGNSNGPWTLTVLTSPSETPDPAAAERNARAQTPAWVQLEYIATTEPVINEGSRTIDSATVLIDAPPTIGDVT